MNTDLKETVIRNRGALVRAGILAAWAVGIGMIPFAGMAADAEKAKDAAAAEEELNNWITFSAGSVFVNGQPASFKQRNQLPDEPFGGIEDFHYELPVKKKGMLVLDGRAIANQKDYLFKFDLSHPDIGYFRAGYRSYLNYYDGTGGWFPKNNQFINLYDPSMAVERAEVWTEAQYILPDESTLTFGFRHLKRHGRKDSTIWGDTGLVGLAAGTTRGLVPSFWDIDETRDIFTLDYRKTIAKTDFGLGVRFEKGETDNRRQERRRPGEAQDRSLTQREAVQSDLFSTHAFSESRLREDLLFTTGFSYTTLDTDLDGSRIYGSSYDPVYDPAYARRQQRDEGFLSLNGGTRLHQYVGNLNLLYTPVEGLSIVPAVRIESMEQDGVANFTETNIGSLPLLAASQEPLSNLRSRALLDVSESLEARYNGIKDWVFFIRGELLQGSGDLSEDERDAVTQVSGIRRDTDSNRFVQKYTAGANWYPLRGLNFSGQYYHKVRENEYSHLLDTTSNLDGAGDRYPAYLTGQNFTTDDANVRMTWRPFANLTLVTRYDIQWSNIETAADHLAAWDAAEIKSHILSETVTWSPLPRWYLQAGVNYVMDRTETPANDVDGAGLNVVLRSINNYWNASFLTGVALDEKTDFEAQYYYYQAENYVDNSTQAVPFGVEGKTHGVTATISRKITAAIRASLRYGFFQNDDVTSGGHKNYDAHLVMTSVQYKF